MKKKLISLILAAALCLGLAIPAFAADEDIPLYFEDVPADSWYAEPVAWAVKQGITSGTSVTPPTFSPDDLCTRAQIMTFLWRAAGSPEPKNISAFPDVNTGAYYAKAAAWAAENGMVSGSVFSPDDPCTRETAMEFMWKQAGSPRAAAAGFTDVSSDAVNWAVEQGVTTGTSTTQFSPDAICTRAQIMTFLYRAFGDPQSTADTVSGGELEEQQTEQSDTSTDFISEVVRLVNEERAAYGLSPLQTMEGLTAAAQIRAEELPELFSHTRPDGSSCFTVLNEAGIKYSMSGENIAAGQSTPAAVVSSWMDSEGHRANILNSRFQYIGVGYVQTNSGYGRYWTQLFVG